MDKDVAISVQNVSKSFKLPHEKYTGLKQAAVNFRPGKKFEMQHVLKDIDFEIKKGEFFGIVGRNGSGKSTLLKVLAQIYTPEKGGVAIDGSLTPFIELGVGFNPELTGRENVYLNGALLGFDRRAMSHMYNDIVDFAELSQFMDQKLKNYSSGMQVRLAFSIAIRANSDILLIDEVLAVGDAAFQQKCFDYFEQLKHQKQTIVFVSHDMSAVKQFCSRAMLVDKGEIAAIGKPSDIALEYERLMYASTTKEKDSSTDEGQRLAIGTFNHKNERTTSFEYGEEITFEAQWPKDYNVGIIGFAIFKGVECVFATNTIGQDINISNRKVRFKVEPKFGNGRYTYVVGAFGKSRHIVIEYLPNNDFMIFGQPQNGPHGEEWEGLIYTDHTWLT